MSKNMTEILLGLEKRSEWVFPDVHQAYFSEIFPSVKHI